MPKILLWDIEITANLGYAWQKWETNIIEFKEEFSLLCYSYKWLGDKKTHVVTRQFHKDDKLICESLRNLLISADVAIGHNTNAFDIKKLNARLAFHKLSPCKKLSAIDTKLVAKRYFAFNSNSLDDLGKYLGLGRKVKHEGFSLWLGCEAGDKKAWKKMVQYARMDVVLLEKIYNRLKPFIQDHPSLAAIKEKVGCPTCSSSHVQKRGVRANHSGLRQQMLCRSCGAWFLTRYRPSPK